MFQIVVQHFCSSKNVETFSTPCFHDIGPTSFVIFRLSRLFFLCLFVCFSRDVRKSVEAFSLLAQTIVGA